ncbi:unnamed protein product [Durusdinium trenchii]|uniref:TNFR-Cys domain-containing protein n=1 Tax=Durusdinium trenchii TaxID=1381693 RepID=A0ABP0MMZ4_9DINO
MVRATVCTQGHRYMPCMPLYPNQLGTHMIACGRPRFECNSCSMQRDSVDGNLSHCTAGCVGRCQLQTGEFAQSLEEHFEVIPDHVASKEAYKQQKDIEMLQKMQEEE